MKRRELIRAAAKQFERTAFKALGLCQDGGTITEEDHDDLMEDFTPEEAAILAAAEKTGVLEKAWELFISDGVVRIVDEAIDLGLVTRGRRAEVIAKATARFKDGLR